MNKEFVTYEQALALKELGFDEPCILLYRGLDTQPVCQMGYEFKTEKNSDYNDETNYWLTVPTYSQAFRWFREKHDLEGVVQQANDYTWYKFSIYQKSNFYTTEGWKVLKSKGLEYETHKEAESACLDKLIEIVRLPKS
jgi:hypothetical protein